MSDKIAQILALVYDMSIKDYVVSCKSCRNFREKFMVVILDVTNHQHTDIPKEPRVWWGLYESTHTDKKQRSCVT